ncbi:MAG: hypothetical protein ACXAEN_14800 [Candidatus Thorarchaeota archaeon]|jgi:hypothetical protein
MTEDRLPIIGDNEIFVERRIRDPVTGLTKKVVREPLSDVSLLDISEEKRELIRAAAQRAGRKGK